MLKLYNLGAAGWTVSWLEREFYSRAECLEAVHTLSGTFITKHREPTKCDIDDITLQRYRKVSAG